MNVLDTMTKEEREESYRIFQNKAELIKKNTGYRVVDCDCCLNCINMEQDTEWGCFCNFIDRSYWGSAHRSVDYFGYCNRYKSKNIERSS